MSTNPSPYTGTNKPTGTAGGDLAGTYPNPTVTGTHLGSALPIAQGGTGAGTASGAVSALGAAPSGVDVNTGGSVTATHLTAALPVAQGGTGAGTVLGAASALSFMTQMATTGTAGASLINGTQSILTWNVPNDGALHAVVLTAGMHVTSTETGGAVVLNITQPDGSTSSPSIFTAGQSTGATPGGFTGRVVQAGSSVILQQSSALSGGAAILWADIWGL